MTEIDRRGFSGAALAASLSAAWAVAEPPAARRSCGGATPWWRCLRLVHDDPFDYALSGNCAFRSTFHYSS